jgi:hypothetical protein
MRVKPGKLNDLIQTARSYDRLDIDGFINTFVYQMDSDPNEIHLAVIFESREAYMKNANDSGQDARYREMLAMLESEPEWHDGEVISGLSVEMSAAR